MQNEEEQPQPEEQEPLTPEMKKRLGGALNENKNFAIPSAKRGMANQGQKIRHFSEDTKKKLAEAWARAKEALCEGVAVGNPKAPPADESKGAALPAAPASE